MMWVGGLRLTFRVRQARSLKDKRALRSQVFGVVGRLDLAGAEVGDADRLDRLVLGFSVVGAEQGVVRRRLEQARRQIEDAWLAEVVDHRLETFKMSEERGSWIPDELLSCQDD